jgi:hypothetical protein
VSPAGRVPSGLLAPSRAGLIGGRRQLEEENERLRRALESIGVGERDRLLAEIAAAQQRRNELRRELADLSTQVVQTQEASILQEVGIYAYRHPLTDALAFRVQLESLQAEIKQAAKDKQAVVGTTNWIVNDSEAEGRRMVADFCKLMLRAYNNEADNLVRALKPYKLDPALDRLSKTKATIERLGKSLDIKVSDRFHWLRMQELSLTADYLAKQAEEKEAEREQKAALREEAAAQREIEREQAKLDKERSHYESALEAMRANGDDAAIASAEAKLAEIDQAKEGLADRAANTRAGYVYVISNVGAFGPGMVKIGMTRRLEPLDRVRELGDASVPFRYDVHAMIFSQDAVGLEGELHRHFADRRVNWVNNHREFFYVSPGQVRDALVQMQGDMLTFSDEAEALEWRQSQTARAAADPTFAPAADN